MSLQARFVYLTSFLHPPPSPEVHPLQVDRRGPSIRNDPQTRRQSRRGTQYTLSRLRALPNWEVQWLREPPLPLNATRARVAPAVCSPSGGVVPQAPCEHVLRRRRAARTTLRRARRH
jgi:hypothetical protein